MVMMITRFHRLIQSRLLWGIFLLVIVFSFVIWGTVTPSGDGNAEEANAAGKLDGKFISREEFRHAYFNMYMSLALGIGRRFDIDDELDMQLRESAWRRLAALHEAKRLGIETSDEEVLATLQSQPAFSIEGRFNYNAYAAFIQNLLAPMGFSEAHFEQHVREEITLQKLQRVIQQSILVAPLDIFRTFRSLTDEFDVQYVILSKESIADGVEVSREDAQDFFLSDPEAFTIPAQVLVKYIAIPVENFLEAAVVTNEHDALGYYDQFMDDFVVTNEVTITRTEIADDGELIEVDVVTNRPETLSFDLVKTNIFEILTRRAAFDQVADAAVDFVVALAPDRQGVAPTFEEAAAKHGYEVKQAGPFSVFDELPDVDAGQAFNLAAFSLRPNPEDYFSDAVVGSNFVYVIGLDERMAPRMPEFAEIEEKALAAAREDAINEALFQKAEELRETAVEAVENGRTFESVAKSFGLELMETGVFTLSEGMETNDYSDMLIRGILPRNEREITDVLPIEDGMLVAHVARRTPGDSSLLPSIAPQIRETVRQQRTRILFNDWENYLLTKAGFQDLLPSRTQDREDEEDWLEKEEEQESPEPAADEDA